MIVQTTCKFSLLEVSCYVLVWHLLHPSLKKIVLLQSSKSNWFNGLVNAISYLFFRPWPVSTCSRHLPASRAKGVGSRSLLHTRIGTLLDWKQSVQRMYHSLSDLRLRGAKWEVGYWARMTGNVREEHDGIIKNRNLLSGNCQIGNVSSPTSGT